MAGVLLEEGRWEFLTPPAQPIHPCDIRYGPCYVLEDKEGPAAEPPKSPFKDQPFTFKATFVAIPRPPHSALKRCASAPRLSLGAVDKAGGSVEGSTDEGSGTESSRRESHTDRSDPDLSWNYLKQLWDGCEAAESPAKKGAGQPAEKAPKPAEKGAGKLAEKAPKPAGKGAGKLAEQAAWPTARTAKAAEKPEQAAEQRGEDGCCTVMLRGLPNRARLGRIKEFITDVGFGMCESVYMPLDAKTGMNKGYAFVHFPTPLLAHKFIQAVDGTQLPRSQSSKLLSASAASYQGAASIPKAHDRNQAREFKASVWKRDGTAAA